MGDIMSKLEEFKLFIKENSYLIDRVHNKETSWQKLYETYDIYGPSHELFKQTVSQKNTSTLLSKEGINSAINAFKKVDLDKVSSGLDQVKKVVGAIQEITKPDGETPTIPEYMKKSTFRRYND